MSQLEDEAFIDTLVKLMNEPSPTVILGKVTEIRPRAPSGHQGAVEEYVRVVHDVAAALNEARSQAQQNNHEATEQHLRKAWEAARREAPEIHVQSSRLTFPLWSPIQGRLRQIVDEQKAAIRSKLK